jgi:hypothetical protein
LSAGAVYAVDLKGLQSASGTLEDPYVRVHDSTGALVAENDDIVLGIDRESQLTFTAATTGTYYIEAGAFADNYTGTYALRASHYVVGDDSVNGLTGTAENDTLVGFGGNDAATGGAGADSLTGGLGQDVLTGGADADVFKFSSTLDSPRGFFKRDVITDFAHLTDHIDLIDIDAGAKTVGNQAFHFIGQHHKAGELHFVKQNFAGTAHDITIISGDVNGDGKADFQIELSGLHNLTRDDFVL